jgi:hypothetical protein
MRQERNYFRQLKSVKHEINELYPSARHAYIAIGLAVKTGRPHNVIPAKAGISHFFIKELSLQLVQSMYGRSQNIVSNILVGLSAVHGTCLYP